MIVTLRTDKPESEIGLYDGQKQLAYHTWQAHRQLAETIHTTLREVLQSQGKNLAAITGLIVYRGPGSFTGLRIGMSVGNALASALAVPIVSANGEDWIVTGLQLLKTNPQKVVVPEYGMPAATTLPRK